MAEGYRPGVLKMTWAGILLFSACAGTTGKKAGAPGLRGKWLGRSDGDIEMM
jgi:hypothetical protein